MPDLRRHHGLLVSDLGRRQEYISRINRVCDYIETNLDRELTLDELARVASFSKFHFHRLFRAFSGETLFQFIQRLRLERAAYLLLNDPEKPITAVALDCGFSGPAVFTRSFRSRFRLSPSTYRKRGQTKSKLGQSIGNTGKAPPSASVYVEYKTRSEVWRIAMDDKSRTVEVRELPARTVAYLRHVGPYKGDAQLFERLFGRLFRWAGPRGLIDPQKTETLIIYHDNPEITAEEKLRVSVCITVPEGTAAEGEVGTVVIPAGKYALARFELAQDEFQQAWDWVYGQWLPQSGYLPDDRPCFEMYPEPRRPDGRFLVDICVPVKPA